MPEREFHEKETEKGFYKILIKKRHIYIENIDREREESTH